MAYMGFEDINKSTRLSLDGVIALAKENGYDYDITDKGIRLIDAEGKSRSFGSNPTAGAIGKFMGYAEGGLIKKAPKTNFTDYRKTGLFK